MKPIAAAGIAAVAIALAPGPAAADPGRAGELRVDPRHDVSRVFDAVVRLVAEADPARPELLERALVALLADRVDWEEVSRRTLTGATWERLPAKQRARFERAWRAWLLGRHVRDLPPRVVPTLELLGPTRVVAADVSVVPTRVVWPDGRSDEVLWRLRFSGRGPQARWRLADMVVKDLSRVQTYKAAIKPLYKSRGFEAMVTAVEKHTRQP